METDVYVGNLGGTVTEIALRTAFTTVGVVKSVTILKSPQTGRSRGFGFVRFGSEEEAAAAIQSMNGKELEGKPIRVSDARERLRQSRGDGRRFDEDGGYGSVRRSGGARRSSSKRRK